MNEFSPLYVVMELSARCYADCPGCFRKFVDGDFDGDMSRETFENAVKGIKPGVMCLPQFHGESLLHKDFEGFLARYKELGLRVSMPASGSAGERHIPALVGANTPVYILIMSVDGFCEHSQEVRRGNISLEKVTKFTELALRERGRREKPWIAVRWVEGGQSELEFERYVKHWLFSVGVDFILRSRMFTYGTALNSPVSLSENRCRSLVEGNPVVLFNGDVLLCERVPDRKRYVLGNVNEDSWETLMNRREEMTSVPAPYPLNAPCKLCSAAYLLTGFAGVTYLRHPDDEKQRVPIYVHSDHSQTFYSLTKNWQGINWSLK